jgi:hypothetical protein
VSMSVAVPTQVIHECKVLSFGKGGYCMYMSNRLVVFKSIY